MPIKGLSEIRWLPRIGKIKMGIKVGEGEKEHPQKTDYFVCPPEVQKIYGGKPTSLDIIIPVENDEMWKSQWYKLYSRTRGLVCRGDGFGESGECERIFDCATGMLAHKDAKTVEKRPYNCYAERCPEYIQKDGCKPVMALMFCLYKVSGLGIYEIDTSSRNSIININSCADYVRGIYGKVSWIPLRLTIGPKEVNSPELGGRRIKVYVLNFSTDKTLLEMFAETKVFQSQLPQGSRIMLPRPDDDLVPEDLAIDGEEPPEVIQEDVKAAVNSPTATSPETVTTTTAPIPATVIAAGTTKTEMPTSEEVDKIFLDMKSAGPRIKVHPEEIGGMINDLRKKKVEAVSRTGLTDRFLNTYRVQREELAKAKSYADMLNLLCDEHLQDFVVWLTELTNKN